MQITDMAGRIVEFEKVPERIVVLTKGDLDVLYALGGQAVGRPSFRGKVSPEAAKDAIEVVSGHQASIEKIALAKPDVVIASKDVHEGQVAAIEAIQTKVILTQANSVQDILKSIALIGELTNRKDEAVKVTAQIQSVIDTAKGTAQAKAPKALLVYGAPGSFAAALPTSLPGNLLELAGGTNVASDYPQLKQYTQYAELSVENVVASNPDIIFLLTHGNPEEVKKSFTKEMEQNAAWKNLAAVRAGKIVVLPATLFGTNPGTKVGEALTTLQQALKVKQQ
ncbi:ABC transporter substrate-binding protein [Paenibacillus sp. 481]|nr:ABC transporter substrate-binding protein [Paenibacillus sp. 481]